MSNWPTKSELQAQIDGGQMCIKCGKHPAELGQIQGVWAIVQCEQCTTAQSKLPPMGAPAIDSDRVYSVHTAPNGTQIPVNQNGNVINPVHAKYTRRPGERPRW